MRSHDMLPKRPWVIRYDLKLPTVDINRKTFDRPVKIAQNAFKGFFHSIASFFLWAFLASLFHPINTGKIKKTKRKKEGKTVGRFDLLSLVLYRNGAVALSEMHNQVMRSISTVKSTPKVNHAFHLIRVIIQFSRIKILATS